MGLCISALTAKTLIYDLENWTSLRPQEAQKSGEGIEVEPQVKALINSTIRFDIRATVWLHVTEQFRQNKSLPPRMRVLRSRQGFGTNRSAAVVSNGFVFQVRKHGLPLACAYFTFLVEPLYSQPLGPASLRGAFRVLPLNPLVQIY
jgi:hypothetical protein